MAKKPTKENEVKEKERVEDAVQEEKEPVTAESGELAEETPEEPKTVEKEKYDEVYDKYLRVLAEYDNYKKRTQKEKDEMYSLAVAETLEKLLPVADNLDRAISALDETEHSEFSEGVKMVSKQFFEIFGQGERFFSKIYKNGHRQYDNPSRSPPRRGVLPAKKDFTVR